MTPEREIYLANRAAEVLENEAYLESWTAIRAEIVKQWEDSPARDEKARETLWLMLKQCDKLRITLEATMQAGKLAAANLAHKEKTLHERVMNEPWPSD